jgi:hypothetical protein
MQTTKKLRWLLSNEQGECQKTRVEIAVRTDLYLTAVCFMNRSKDFSAA